MNEETEGQYEVRTYECEAHGHELVEWRRGQKLLRLLCKRCGLTFPAQIAEVVHA